MRVLIAEDHMITARLLERMLKADTDLEIVGVASNGKQVLSMVKEHEIDIILMDINMPFLDGLHAMEKISYINPNIKIIVVSGYTEAWIIKFSISSGAQGYLSKRVNVGEILEAINVVREGGTYLDEFSLNAIVDDYDIKDNRYAYT
jgi:DNA-binding NarL/FixJ family response regulator